MKFLILNSTEILLEFIYIPDIQNCFILVFTFSFFIQRCLILDVIIGSAVLLYMQKNSLVKKQNKKKLFFLTNRITEVLINESEFVNTEKT